MNFIRWIQKRNERESEIKKNVHKTCNAIKTVVDLNFQVRKKNYLHFSIYRCISPPADWCAMMFPHPSTCRYGFSGNQCRFMRERERESIERVRTFFSLAKHHDVIFLLACEFNFSFFFGARRCRNCEIAVLNKQECLTKIYGQLYRFHGMATFPGCN